MTIGWSVIVKVRQNSAEILKQTVNNYLFKEKFSQKNHLATGTPFDKHAKKRQKTETMLNVWKDLFVAKVFGKTCLASKSPSGNVDSPSDNSPDNFRPKVRFFHRILKKTPPPPPPPVMKNVSKLNIFPGKIFSWRSLSGHIKTPFWQSVFKCGKMSAERLEKVLKTLIQPKKDRLPKKTLQICRNQFWQSCWNFSEIVRIFAPKVYEKNLLSFQKMLSNCL